MAHHRPTSFSLSLTLLGAVKGPSSTPRAPFLAGGLHSFWNRALRPPGHRTTDHQLTYSSLA